MTLNLCYEIAAISASAAQRPAISELVETEETFIETLKTIEDPFLKNLKPYLNHQDQEFILILKCLVNAHSSFYKKLIRCQSVVKILELFTNWYDEMLVHGLYLYRLPFIQNSIDQICICNESLKEQIEKDVQAYKYLSLTNDLLIRPSQRFLKYKLLIEKLIVMPTPISSDNDQQFRVMGQRAIEVVEDVSRYLNEVSKSSTDWENFKDVTNRISNWKDENSMKMEAFGVLLHEGKLNVLWSGNETHKLHYIILFSQKLIACDIIKTPDQETKKSFLYSWDLDLHNFNLKDIEGNKKVFVLQSRGIRRQKGGSYYSTEVVPSSVDCDEVIEIKAKTSAAKGEWLSKFREAIDLLQPAEAKNSSHQFDIISFKLPAKTKCDQCRKLLRGSYPAGYRCKICHAILHKECLILDQICQNTERDSLQSLDYHPWNAGKMSREAAELALNDTPTGTFLLRYKLETFVNGDTKRYAISVKCTTSVKHLRIQQEKLFIQREQYVYFLREDKKFHSVRELMDFFSKHKLKEYFSDSLNVELSTPWRLVVATAIALYDYTSTKEVQIVDGNFKTISFEKDQHIIITGKEYNEYGWWRGISDGKEGHFPKIYVKPYSSDSY